jgi:hypothetical protein
MSETCRTCRWSGVYTEKLAKPVLVDGRRCEPFWTDELKRFQCQLLPTPVKVEEDYFCSNWQKKVGGAGKVKPPPAIQVKPVPF